MNSRITVVENGLPIGLNGTLVQGTHAYDWHGFPIEIRSVPGEIHTANRYNPNPMIFRNLTATGYAEMRAGNRSYSANLVPGIMHVFEADFEVERCTWKGLPGVFVALDLTKAHANRLLPEEMPLQMLKTEVLTTDNTLATLMDAMRAEIEGGCQSGRLYAEGLSIALLGYLGARFSSRWSPNSVVGSRSSQRLTPASIRIVRDYIHQHLAADLSITELGKLLNLSAFHFARMFKASVGVSPHRFILAQRVERATLLLGTGLPLSDIAVIVGFSSQAHFTKVFRELTGITPARSRRR